MPIAHACRGCGECLTRVRAPLEPSLGLQVVVCPRCGVADVRRRHPITHAWRRRGRVLRGTVGLAMRLAVTMALGGGCFLCAELLLESVRDLSPWGLVLALTGISPNSTVVEAWRDREGPIVLAGAACWFVLIGTILSGALGHVRRRWLLWPGFGAVLLLQLGVALMADWADTYRPWIGPAQPASAQAPDPGHINLSAWAAPLVVIPAGLAFAATGVPIGRMIQRSTERRARRAWQRRLARERKRRARA